MSCMWLQLTLKILTPVFIGLKNGTVVLEKSCSDNVGIESLNTTSNGRSIFIKNKIKVLDYNNNGLL